KPVKNEYQQSEQGQDLSNSPVNVPGQKTWPIMIPFGMKDILNCCTGQYSNSILVWDFQAFEPYPTGVTKQITVLAQAICQSGGFSWNYKPGADCNGMTRSFCNPGTDRFESSSNCDCQNIEKMYRTVGIPYPAPPGDVGLAQTQQILSSNIGCL